MKTINVALLVLAGLLTGAWTTGERGISGRITGTENDTLLLFASDPLTRKQVCTVTVLLADGRFSVSLPDSAVLSVTLMEKPSGGGTIPLVYHDHLYRFAGEQLEVNGSLGDLKISGTALYDELNGLPNIQELENEFGHQKKIYSDLAKDQEKNLEALYELLQETKATLKALDQVKRTAIRENPHTLAAGYLALSLTGDGWTEAYSLLGSEVKSGLLGRLLALHGESERQEQPRREAARNIGPDKPAPDFKLKDLNGELVTLASFRGKYLLLDFWGSWCGGCIKEFPNMKRYYEKYRSKVEFAGVNCTDSDYKWRKSVKEHQLPWPQLYAGEDNPMKADYAIRLYPTMILIDPEGVIVEVSVGESLEMYYRLDGLFE